MTLLEVLRSNKHALHLSQILLVHTVRHRPQFNRDMLKVCLFWWMDSRVASKLWNKLKMTGSDVDWGRSGNNVASLICYQKALASSYPPDLVLKHNCQYRWAATLSSVQMECGLSTLNRSNSFMWSVAPSNRNTLIVQTRIAPRNSMWWERAFLSNSWLHNGGKIRLKIPNALLKRLYLGIILWFVHGQITFKLHCLMERNFGLQDKQ